MRPIVTKFCCSAALISLLSGCAELIAIEVATAVMNAATSGTERSSSNRMQKSDEVVTNNYEPEKSCSDSPSICTSEKLCDFATKKGQWEIRSSYLPFVDEAKRRGLSCSVTVAKVNLNYTDNCLGKIARCTNEIICVGAKTQPLYFGSGDAYWSEHPVFQKYVLEAKRRKQDCSKF